MEWLRKEGSWKEMEAGKERETEKYEWEWKLRMPKREESFSLYKERREGALDAPFRKHGEPIMKGPDWT